MKLRVPSTNLGELRRSVPARVTDEAIEAGSKVEGAFVIDLPLELLEVAVSQLITIPGVEVISPRRFRIALHDRARQAAACNGL